MGNQIKQRTPKQIDFFIKNNIQIRDITSGFYHNLAVDYNNNVYSWGYNGGGQCGDGTKTMISTPTLIPALKNEQEKQTKCGGNHCYVNTVDNKHYIFGSNVLMNASK